MACCRWAAARTPSAATATPPADAAARPASGAGRFERLGRGETPLDARVAARAGLRGRQRELAAGHFRTFAQVVDAAARAERRGSGAAGTHADTIVVDLQHQ